MASEVQQPGAADLTGPLLTPLSDHSPSDRTADAEQPFPDGKAAEISLTPGARPLPEYELVRLLGRGGFGEVWLANGPGGFEVALKFIRLGAPAAQVELRSLELVKDIHHPHLLTTFGTWRQGEYLIIAMEVAPRTLMPRAPGCSDTAM